MPIFFTEETLSKEQKIRYPEAVQEYHAIQMNNAQKKKDKLKKDGVLTPEIEQKIDDAIQKNQPGIRSALFHRLLCGLPPLQAVPPTSFGYPWYEVIEGNEPLQAFIGGIDNKHLIINNCMWIIDDYNDVAQKMILQGEFSEQQLRNFLNNKPEFIVSYNNGGQYKVYLGRRTITGRRDSIMKGNVTLDMAGGNPIVLKVVQSGEQRIAQEQQVRQDVFRQNDAQLNDILTQLEDTFTKPQNASDWDWVEAEVDSWMIERYPK